MQRYGISTAAPVSRRLRVAAFLTLGLAVAALSFGCSGKADDSRASTSPTATTAAGPASGPGTLTLTSSALRGQNDRVLLVFVTQEGRGPLARACIRVTSNAFTVGATEMTDVPAGNDPCSGSSPSTRLPEGRYTITAGIYAPPAQAPDKQVTVTVEVKGNVQVALDGNALSR